VRVPSIDEALRRLREAQDVRHGSGADEDEVVELERRFSVTLPAGYRSFLLQIGWASAGDIAIFGLGTGVPADLDLRTVVAAERHQDLPKNLVPFARDKGEAIFCLDATHAGPYESPVYRCHHRGSTHDAVEYVGHDFASWLWMRLAERA